MLKKCVRICPIKNKKQGLKRLNFKPCNYIKVSKTFYLCGYSYLLSASFTATAQATVIPTIGLLPAPIRPIISTWAGTEEEPAN